MIYLNDHIEEIDIEQAQWAVSEQRWQYAMRYRQHNDRQQSLAAYLLLCDALRNEYGIAEPQEFAFGPHGKPHLKDYPDIHFNLSHCRCAALCVVGDHPVGCDIEAVPTDLDMDLCRYCLDEEEVAHVVASESPTLAFTELWTKKEALMKYTGEGLTKELATLLSSRRAADVSFHTCIAPNRSYVYTVCSHSSFPYSSAMLSTQSVLPRVPTNAS